ncbi:MAG TPA: hypothetical protein VNY10_22960 [Roseiarcus sp.]|nr:hypothetical protein [Roseiarcus sp.]
MKSIHRSVLTPALMTGMASLVFMTFGAAGVRAESVIVEGEDGANDATAVDSGENGGPVVTESPWPPPQAA